MNSPVISVNNVSMMFNLSRDKVLGIKDYVVKALQRKLFYDEFWALKNISFEVQKGEVLGILGLNGSGKSTLLKIIAGVFKPTQGSVYVQGEIAPLLELGAGFDPEFSAKENVYFNGAMFGRSPLHMKAIYDEIIDFAELWEFEDVPIKNFSSGMSARLGFAVATCINPEVLILDEVLGVGDFLFKEKCEKRIAEMLSCGATVLLVSHAVDTIKSMCSRAILLKKGEMVHSGDVDEVCQVYEEGANI
ncbi:MAG: ABC transporter ATP-binding protein [Defluviitaleaceae bacterium]|nr:ABC transporter ATP-binding protein [Defluviitaleaceae bacterium]MCL2238334.1 ABC transporter ATP-binding protein [Defluviitaleaceae bacterium]